MASVNFEVPRKRGGEREGAMTSLPRGAWGILLQSQDQLDPADIYILYNSYRVSMLDYIIL